MGYMLAVAVFQLLTGSCLAEEPTIPNLDYVGKGYDIVYGNPRPSVDQTDDGWQSNVFDQDYSEERTVNIDGVVYLVPDDHEVLSCKACSVQFTSTEAMSASEYKDSLEANVVVNAKGWGAKFKASAGYKEVEESFYSRNSRVIEASAQCRIFCASVTDNSSPRITENFASAVRNLPDSYDRIQYLNLINDFGTHYAKRIDLGVRVGSKMELSASSVQQMKDEEVDISVEAEFKAFGASGGGSVGVEKDNSESQTLDKHVTNTRIFQYGGTFIDSEGEDKNAAAEEWYELSKSSPLPLKVELEQLSTLLTSETFPDELNIRNKRLNLLTAMNEYCGELQAQGIVAECVDALYEIERKGPFGGPVPENPLTFNDHGNWDALNQPRLLAIDMNFDQTSGALTGVRTTHEYGDETRQFDWNGKSDSQMFTLKLDQAIGNLLQEQVTGVEVCTFTGSSTLNSQPTEAIGRVQFETNVERPQPIVFETDVYHYVDERLTWLEAEKHCNGLGGFLASPEDTNERNDIQEFLHESVYSQKGEWIYFEDPKTWVDAKTQCEALGDYQLASPSTAFQVQVLARFFQDETALYQPERMWIGGSANGGLGYGPGTSNHNFKWIDGTEVLSDFGWNTGEPNNFNDDENCMEFWKESAGSTDTTWLFNDIACSRERSFVCQPRTDGDAFDVWLGANDRFIEGGIFWSDHSAFVDRKLEFVPPGSNNELADCLGFDLDDPSQWNPTEHAQMRPCDERRRSLCRAPAARNYTCHNVEFPTRLGLLFMSGTLAEHSGGTVEIQSLSFNGYLETLKEDEPLVDDVIDSEVNPNASGAAASGGLSGGAIAGVVVGSIAAIAIVGAIGLLFYRRSGANKHKSSVVVSPAAPTVQVNMPPAGASANGGANAIEPSVSAYYYDPKVAATGGANYGTEHSHSQAPSVSSYNYVPKPEPSVSASANSVGNPLGSRTVPIAQARPPPPYTNGAPQVNPNLGPNVANNSHMSHTMRAPVRVGPPRAAPGAPGNFMSKTPPFRPSAGPARVPQFGGGGLAPGGMRPISKTPPAGPSMPTHRVPQMAGGGLAPGGMRPISKTPPAGPSGPPHFVPQMAGGGLAPGGMRPISKTPPAGPSGPPHFVPPMSGGGHLGAGRGRPIPKTPPMAPQGGRGYH